MESKKACPPSFSELLRHREAVDDHPELGAGASADACEYVFFAEGRHENVAFLVTSMVVDYADHAIGALHTVGIGNAVSFVQNQSPFPSLTVILGEESGKIRARTPG